MKWAGPLREATTPPPPPPLYPIPCNSLTTLMSLIAQGRGQTFPSSNDFADKQFTRLWKPVPRNPLHWGYWRELCAPKRSIWIAFLY